MKEDHPTARIRDIARDLGFVVTHVGSVGNHDVFSVSYHSAMRSFRTLISGVVFTRKDWREIVSAALMEPVTAL